MMTLAFFLLGGLAGIFAWLYIDRFIPNLQQEIYQNYIELYPEIGTYFTAKKQQFNLKSCGQYFSLFFRVWTLFCCALLLSSG